MKIKEIIGALEQFAPLPLQESYDNAGLQCGLTEAEALGALLCLDVTEDVLREAVDLGCNLVVSHHPLLFHGLKQVSDADLVQRCIRLAIQNDICIYSAHTNLDNAEDGVNFRISEKLGLIDVQLLSPRMVSVGARQVKCGSGTIGYLPEAEDSLAFLQRVKQAFGIEALQHNQLLERPIQSVVVCGGAGDFLLPEAIRAEADAFLTGEMHYHTWFGHEQEVQIAVMGHYESEQYTREIFREIIERTAPQLPIYDTEVRTNPIQIL
ncbi:MAG: Nif3-like dinuclear metal center hexameric protein [Bacteroidaceae bacterium]|nr:Nif3-like dinuclear metal center hexameric protein [Bacteroidaceae bacterium]MBQ8938317.1 Nif3-like dinuclear metal center hexameric protein [Bacteroidaceae bacterium]MBQ9190249.1 Nif3-like dinuclear metal center hexameric protein [Bacteroidaceae bacterium]MBR0244132.1 Nif3-like dinuclear metal center hexameric protein [Bacteroidaceae bacterium]MBR1665344.1 Nif3-like dinuclear metal center hexameric protein [Bacteroidaceae bacterium]